MTVDPFKVLDYDTLGEDIGKSRSYRVLRVSETTFKVNVNLRVIFLSKGKFNFIRCGQLV